MTKGWEITSLASWFLDFFSSEAPATMMGMTKKAMMEPAKSKMTVLLDWPTMERYRGRATAPPSTVVRR